MAKIPVVDMDKARIEIENHTDDKVMPETRKIIGEAFNEQWQEWEDKNPDAHAQALIALTGVEIWTSRSLAITCFLVINEAANEGVDRLDVDRIRQAGDLLLDQVNEKVSELIKRAHLMAMKHKLAQYKDSKKVTH